MAELVAVDVGGTNARFALARVDGGAVSLLSEKTLPSDDFASFEDAWRAWADGLGEPLPGCAAIAVAGPVSGGIAAMTNHRWRLDEGALGAALGLERVMLVNDLAAAAWAAAAAGPGDLRPVKPGAARDGTLSVVGLGTGLGGAIVIPGGPRPAVVATECGHIGFSPANAHERALFDRLAAAHGRASAERAVAGPALADHYALLGGAGGADEVALWQAALDGGDPLAVVAMERLMAAFGGVAGDIALAQGAARVVLTGGLAARLGDRLGASDFANRFVAKDRMRGLLERVPVDLLAIDQPGLVGAALAGAA